MNKSRQRNHIPLLEHPLATESAFTPESLIDAVKFMVVTNNYAAIIEVKFFRGPIFGDINGDWLLEDFTQQKKAYAGGNPWQQALGQKFAISDTMTAFQANQWTGPLG